MSAYEPQKPPAATMHTRAQAEIEEEYGARGRWARQDRPTINGTAEATPPLAAPNWCSELGALPNERPINFEADSAMPDMTTYSGLDRAEAEAIDAANRGETEDEQP
jgi:hypothetical protein